MKKLFFSILFMLLCGPCLVQAAGTSSLKVEIKGKGSPLLLIPGLGCSGEVWESTVAALEKRYECHVLTLPGFGGHPAISYQNDDYLQQVKAQIIGYLDARDLQQVGLIGHSLGGFLSLQLAAEQPERFSSVLVVDALPFLAAMRMPGITAEGVQPIAENMRRMMLQQPQESREANQRGSLHSMVTAKEDLEKVLAMNLASEKEVMAQAMYEMMVTDMREKIAGIKAPVRVLGAWIAYKEYGVTKENSLQAYSAQYAKLPDVKVEMSDKGRHFIMYDDPEFYFAQLQEVFPH